MAGCKTYFLCTLSLSNISNTLVSIVYIDIWEMMPNICNNYYCSRLQCRNHQCYTRFVVPLWFRIIILMTILMIKSQAENGGQRVIIRFSFFFIKASVQWVYMNFYTYSKKNQCSALLLLLIIMPLINYTIMSLNRLLYCFLSYYGYQPCLS